MQDPIAAKATVKVIHEEGWRRGVGGHREVVSFVAVVQHTQSLGSKLETGFHAVSGSLAG